MRGGMAVLIALSAAGLAQAGAELDHRISLASTMAFDPSAQPAGEAKPEAPKAELSFWEGWKRNVDLGLNGSDGNSQTLNVRVAVGTERKSDRLETKAGISYVVARDDNRTTKSRGEGFVFNNWLFGADSRWGLFGQVKAEYDEFQAWDWRLSGAFGPSYMIIKEENTTLRGRVGVAFSYETGGELQDEKVSPELDLGLDFAHTFKEGHKLFANADYYPSLDEFPAYRAVAQAGYEILLSKENNLVLKLGLQDRYDSTPGVGFRRNDLEYFVTLSFNF